MEWKPYYDAELETFELSDYTPILDTDSPCLVASALIAYKNRNASRLENWDGE